MKQFFKVLLIAIILVGAILLSVVLVDNVILPNVSAEFQYRWVYLILSTLGIVALLDAVAGFTGYTLKDLFTRSSDEHKSSSNHISREFQKRDELYEQKRKDSLFNQNDKLE